MLGFQFTCISPVVWLVSLAELLIVVAIIGVLVGISIPIFTTQLKKSRLATNQANARAAYAAAYAHWKESLKKNM